VERLSVAGPVWAVEDSPAGAVAARAAGLVTIGVVRQPAMRAGLEAAGARCVERLSPALIEGVPGPA
jgi:beta-phosphoglucomutase-like phosphatase (HAD superfamily)